jgi:hypothetical protein
MLLAEVANTRSVAFVSVPERPVSAKRRYDRVSGDASVVSVVAVPKFELGLVAIVSRLQAF